MILTENEDINKRKSNQKRKCVNNQNNSASYYRLYNTWFTSAS